MSSPVRPGLPACFVEHDPAMPIARRATAEGVGTLFLALVAAGSGASIGGLAPGSPALELFIAAISTSGALVSLIVAFGKISGGHFNPLITGLQYLTGDRPLGCTVWYIVAQSLGAFGGVFVARVLFPDATSLPTGYATWPMMLSELVAAAGLMTIIFSCMRSGKEALGPFASGAWLLGAIVATPSRSYVNPALAMAAMVAPGPMALSHHQALSYIVAEIAGAMVSLVPIAIAYPRNIRARPMTGETFQEKSVDY